LLLSYFEEVLVGIKEPRQKKVIMVKM